MTHSITSGDLSHPKKTESLTESMTENFSKTYNTTQRLHYMDNVRALAMFVGILFHAALAFMVYSFFWAV